MSTSTTESGGLPGWAKAAIVLGAGVVLAGLADYALSQAGYPSLGALAWAMGYAGAIAVIWAGWFRHLEFEPGG
ncbi:hypothetical protein [Halorarius litoreus]|uniref:hypothetical protein n=1 Tax=Halorarius litoreus TaxID=2962676 RepID=UPI0020CFBCC3|nr:hypothetical protein [Halorarius litoreus]